MLTADYSSIEIIKPSVVFITEKNPLKRIELAGRVCYKSEDKITENSYSGFVNKMLKNCHTAMLEFGSYCFLLAKRKYMSEPCSKYINVTDMDKYTIMSGNLRAIINEATLSLLGKKLLKALIEKRPEVKETLNYQFVEDITTDDIKVYTDIEDLMSDTIYNSPNHFPEKWKYQLKNHARMTFQIVTDRGITHELVRHRTLSFAQESTRYCNYSKDKFGNKIKVIYPFGTDFVPEWFESVENAAESYFELLGNTTPQMARSLLPTSTAATISVSGVLKDWENFFNLRYFEVTGKVHPQMKEIATFMYDEMPLLYKKALGFEE